MLIDMQIQDYLTQNPCKNPVPQKYPLRSDNLPEIIERWPDCNRFDRWASGNTNEKTITAAIAAIIMTAATITAIFFLLVFFCSARLAVIRFLSQILEDERNHYRSRLGQVIKICVLMHALPKTLKKSKEILEQREKRVNCLDIDIF